jgi:4-amino-4-deoxy-L-arabinose transferase-like glycosyltransferase
VNLTRTHLKLLLLVLIVAVGAFFRLYKLGTLPIEGDNSFQYIAARAIAENGIPKVQSGNIYTRSLPLLYLEAASLMIFGDNEWSLRLPNAIFGILNIVLVYLLTSALCGNNAISITSSFFYSISLWAINTARMPRMYETLEMGVMILWLLFFYWYKYRKKKHFVLLILSAIFTISLHKLAILSGLCFLIPALINKELTVPSIKTAAVFFLIIAIWFLYYHILPSLLNIPVI